MIMIQGSIYVRNSSSASNLSMQFKCRRQFMTGVNSDAIKFGMTSNSMTCFGK